MPLDVFAYGYVRHIVYAQKSFDVCHLRDNLWNAMNVEKNECSGNIKWEDNIKMDLQEVGGVCGDWMDLAQDKERWQALVSMVMNFRVP
jgi:hypothetical protein